MANLSGSELRDGVSEPFPLEPPKVAVFEVTLA